MSELNIDALTLEELKEQAKILGVAHASNIGADALRAKLKEALGESDGTRTESKPEAAPVHRSEKGQKRITILIPESEVDTQPVQVYVNGRSYIMKRGEEVEVPESVVEVLNNAKQMVYNPKTMKGREVLAYPYQTIR